MTTYEKLRTRAGLELPTAPFYDEVRQNRMIFGLCAEIDRLAARVEALESKDVEIVAEVDRVEDVVEEVVERTEERLEKID